MGPEGRVWFKMIPEGGVWIQMGPKGGFCTKMRTRGLGLDPKCERREDYGPKWDTKEGLDSNVIRGDLDPK